MNASTETRHQVAEPIYEVPEATFERYSDRVQWLLARQSGLGGSDAAAVWGYSPYLDHLALYASKVATPRVEDVDEDEWLMVGNELEPGIANIYARRTKRAICDPGRTVIYRSKRWPWMFASLDRLTLDSVRNSYGVLECKHRTAFARHDWADGVPLDVQLQVQHQLAVTGLRWGSVAVLLGGVPDHVDIERDDELIAMHVEKCREFWYEHVVKRVEPESTGLEVSRDAIRRLHPIEKVPSVQLPADTVDLAKERVELSRQIDAATKRKQEIDNRVRQLIGDAAAGTLPDGTSFTLKTIEKSGYVVQPFSYRELRFKPLKVSKEK